MTLLYAVSERVCASECVLVPHREYDRVIALEDPLVPSVSLDASSYEPESALPTSQTPHNHRELGTEILMMRNELLLKALNDDDDNRAKFEYDTVSIRNLHCFSVI